MNDNVHITNCNEHNMCIDIVVTRAIFRRNGWQPIRNQFLWTIFFIFCKTSSTRHIEESFAPITAFFSVISGVLFGQSREGKSGAVFKDLWSNEGPYVQLSNSGQQQVIHKIQAPSHLLYLPTSNHKQPLLRCLFFLLFLQQWVTQKNPDLLPGHSLIHHMYTVQHTMCEVMNTMTFFTTDFDLGWERVGFVDDKVWKCVSLWTIRPVRLCDN